MNSIYYQIATVPRKMIELEIAMNNLTRERDEHKENEKLRKLMEDK